MTEQPRVVTRDQLHDVIGAVDAVTMREANTWLRDFLALL